MACEVSPQAFVCSEPHLRGPMRKPENETKLYENKSEIHNPVCSLVVCNHLGFLCYIFHINQREGVIFSQGTLSQKKCVANGSYFILLKLIHCLLAHGWF